MDINADMIEAIVKKVMQEQKDELTTLREVDKSGIIQIAADRITCDPFPFPIESSDVYLKDIISVAESPRLGCGVMELKNGTSFEWNLTYDELDYIIEGTLDIIIDGRTIRAKAGEVVFIPKDSLIHFSTPDNTRFLYVVYPANWAD